MEDKGKIKDFMNTAFNGGSSEPMMIKVFCLLCNHSWLALLPNGIGKDECAVECPKGCGMQGVPCEEDEL